MQRRGRTLALVLATAITVVPLAAHHVAAQAAPGDHWSATSSGHVVTVAPHVDPATVARELKLKPTQVFEHVDAFVVESLTEAQVRAVTSHPSVRKATPNREILAAPGFPHFLTGVKPPDLRNRQEIPSGVRLIGADKHPVADIDGVDERVDVDVAVLDDGVDPDHPDLNVVRTFDCLGPRYSVRGDHGTHVAGTIGALDNGFGVVGVAPGARIWGVRIFDDYGHTTLAAIFCGMDTVLAHRTEIDVVNMSASFVGSDDGACGVPSDDPVHAAICTLETVGVPFVASAGNDSIDAKDRVPASYDETFTVSAFSDFDGRLGGLGTQFCRQDLDLPDDQIAWWSNFGADVDVAAPGSCILSTTTGSPTSMYDYWIGTSMAAPHVAGAAALYVASRPNATNAQFRRALLRSSVRGPLPGDPDQHHEPLLHVGGL